MYDAIEWLVVFALILLAPQAMRQSKKDKESFALFQSYADDLETVMYPECTMRKRLLLNIPEGWAEMVANAIGETPQKTKLYVLSLWDNGWSVHQIQARLIERATDKGNKLFFVNQLEPYERS